MVSLGEDNKRHGGYRSFSNHDDLPSTSINNGHHLDNQGLGADPPDQFKPIRVTWVIVLHIILLLVFNLAVFLLPLVCSNDEPPHQMSLSDNQNSCGTSDSAIVAYIHGALWLLKFLMDRLYEKQHNQSRILGYLEFYRMTKHVRKFPLLLFSAGNSLLVILLQVLNDHCTGAQCGPISRIAVLQILVSVEVFFMLISLIIYLVRTVKFNRQKPRPDIQQDDLLSSYLLSQAPTSEVGFRDEDYVDDILEKQADMIRYLRQHCSQLSHKVLSLSSQLNTSTA